MRLFNVAVAVAFIGVAAISGAQHLEGDGARARDFAAKAYLKNHPDAKTLPNRVLVKFDKKTSEAEKKAIRGQAKGLLIRRYKIVPGLELIDSTLGAEKAKKMLEKNPHVLYVEEDRVAHTSVVPNDTFFSLMWGLNQANDFDVNAPEAWDIFTGDPNFRIADFDTGIDYNHPDLAANVWTNPGEVPGNGIDEDGNGYIDDIHGYDVVNDDGDVIDDNNHGTHTGGTIGAVGNNAAGVTGVNWQCKIVAIKVFNASGSASDADIMAGMDYLAQTGTKVSNHSWAGGGLPNGADWQSFYDACKAMGDQGHLMVCAAGNFNFDNDGPGDVVVPASFDLPNIISVAAIDSAGAKASFSCWGLTRCDLAAPGVHVASTVVGNYAYFNGTSMATPHVTGGAALLWAFHPGLTYADIKSRILGHTKPVPSMAGLCVTGGMLDLGATITNAAPTAKAGDDVNIEATGPTTDVQLDGSASSDDDKDQFNYDWSEGGTSFSSIVNPLVSLAPGAHTYDLKVTDAHGANTSDPINVTVTDTTAPAFGSVTDVTKAGTSNSGAVVTFASPVAHDLVDGDIAGTCVPPSGSSFPYGSTTVNVSATDAHTNTGHTSFKVIVNYSWSGFTSPLPKSQNKLGSTIPIKFKVNTGVTSMTASAAWATVNGAIIGPEHNIGSFTFSSGYFQLNWKTSGLSKGTYRIFAHLGDGSVHTIDVVLK